MNITSLTALVGNLCVGSIELIEIIIVPLPTNAWSLIYCLHLTIAATAFGTTISGMIGEHIHVQLCTSFSALGHVIERTNFVIVITFSVYAVAVTSH